MEQFRAKMTETVYSKDGSYFEYTDITELIEDIINNDEVITSNTRYGILTIYEAEAVIPKINASCCSESIATNIIDEISENVSNEYNIFNCSKKIVNDLENRITNMLIDWENNNNICIPFKIENKIERKLYFRVNDDNKLSYYEDMTDSLQIISCDKCGRDIFKSLANEYDDDLLCNDCLIEMEDKE